MITAKKVLVLGSGALKIGEAGEFDYSGSQAIKALKEEGIKTVLVNPNIATIQTSKFLADTVYFLPITKYFVEKVIEKEKPDGIFLSFGGQTALNCGLALYEKGILKKHDVTVLGSPISAIQLSEDRDEFAKHLRKRNIKTPHSKTALNKKQALEIADDLGYPVMIRAGFALGGQGSGIAFSKDELEKIAEHAFSFVPQILVEQYLHHFKEIEYEVVRDKDDNCITVCNMENMDPLGIHTGESIVVAPSQTLNNYEYHYLRTVAIDIVRSLKIVGECNVQFALNPRPKNPSQVDYYVIELNARLSRSSALASKATGYPLAYVAAKLALGKNLTQIPNKITKITQSCFEPALDYIVVKLPRWDIEKFKKAQDTIGSSMKSVGEVMGIGRTFEESFQKAIRMLDLELEGVTDDKHLDIGTVARSTKEMLEKPTPKRMFAIARALKEGFSVDEIYKLTGIDPWFSYRIKHIVDHELRIEKERVSFEKIDPKTLREFKQLGFSDKRIGMLFNTTGLKVRAKRKKHGIVPSVFQIDTLAGEFEAKTNYLYMTYNGNHHDIEPSKKAGVVVLGSGPYRIGSSVEFDWTSVNTVTALKDHKKESIIINCNPETVSTDYDVSDKLYFEELTFERIADIYDFENPYGIIISVGGQTPNNRAQSLKSYGCKILGTDPTDIDRAENRSKFSKLLDDLGIMQPAWNTFSHIEAAHKFAKKVGYPVLIRPSYVLSGAYMKVCHNKPELTDYFQKAASVSRAYPITVSKFIEDAKEIEIDCVGEKGELKTFIVSEHIENAGVHSGDASILLPPQKIYTETLRKLENIARDLAKVLNITGPYNIQCMAKENNVYVIEVNLRSSRTFPFISKVTGVNFIKLAVDAFFHKKINNVSTDFSKYNFVAAKVAQFSFARIFGADPRLNVEMASTGEVACFGNTVEEAFLLAVMSVGRVIPEKGIFLSIGGENNKIKHLELVRKIAALQLPLFATNKTAAFLNKNDIKTHHVYKIHEGKAPNTLELFKERKVDLAINFVDTDLKKDIDDDYDLRRAAVDHNIPLFTNPQKAELFIKAITEIDIHKLPIKSWDEYTTQNS